MEGILTEDTSQQYRGDICVDCGDPGECCDCSPDPD